MRNIQAQYKDLLEGKMPKHNFMRNLRMEFPQYVSSTNSYEDAVRILKSKRILSEVNVQGVYGHDPNAENPPKPGIDQLNYYQVYHGIQYELAKMPEITDEAYIAARKKVVDNILKDPDAYKNLQLANFKAVKEMDEDLKMKEVEEDNKVDKPNAMKVVKKDVKGNTEATLEKKEKKTAKNGKGIKQMTMAPKKSKGVEAFPTPGKEKVLALKESILDSYTKPNIHHEMLGKGSRVKKKDGSMVGEIVEWDGDTAAVKDDATGKVHHIQGNTLTKKDVPVKAKEEPKQTENPWDRLPNLGGYGQSWASSQVKKEAPEESRETKMKRLKEKLTKTIKKELEEDLEENLYTNIKSGKVQSFNPNSPEAKDPQFNNVFKPVQ